MLAYLKKNWWWIVTVAIFVVPLIPLYIFVLHPILGTPFMDFEEYRGVEYYTTREYLEFEKGPLFEEVLRSYTFLEDCHVTDFYYSDNRWKDSCVYGKKPDIYGIMLDCGDNYEKVKKQIAAECVSKETYIPLDVEESKDIYVMNTPNDENIILMFMVGQKEEYLSFIMVTESTVSEVKNFYTPLIDVIWAWSTLPF